MASTANTLPSSQPQEQNTDPCRKCGKNNHTMVRCCKRVTYKKCKGKDHSTRCCTGAPAPESKCTFCRKGKHTTENCRAKRRAEKEAVWRTISHRKCYVEYAPSGYRATSGTPSFCTKFRNLTPADRLTWHINTPATNRTKTPELGHGNGCNWHVNNVAWDTPNLNTTFIHCTAKYGWKSYPTLGSTTSVPSLAPGMYNYNHNPGTNVPTRAQSTTSSASHGITHVTAQ